jgi:hypothetical protein
MSRLNLREALNLLDEYDSDIDSDFVDSQQHLTNTDTDVNFEANHDIFTKHLYDMDALPTSFVEEIKSTDNTLEIDNITEPYRNISDI